MQGLAPCILHENVQIPVCELLPLLASLIAAETCDYQASALTQDCYDLTLLRLRHLIWSLLTMTQVLANVWGLEGRTHILAFSCF